MYRLGKMILFLIVLIMAFFDLDAQTTPPAAPDIVCATVDTATGLAQIKWNPSTAADVEKYALYYYIPGGGGALIIDTVNGDTRVYTYPNLVDPSISLQTLTVAAVDSNGAGPLSDPPHSTMFLGTAYDSCNKSMELEWSPYKGWGEELGRYEVYCSVDGGQWNYLGKTDIDTSFLHPDILNNKHYCYFIKAIHPDTCSFSNKACRNVSHLFHPEWINAESASAVGDDHVKLKFVMDPAGEVVNFQLFKASVPGEPFISDIVFTGVSDSLTYLDPVLSTDRKYQYKLYSLDVCGNPVTESNISGNIVLSTSSMGLKAFLSWNPYLDYETGVNNYRIYRDINHTGPVLIDGVEHPDTIFEDDLSFLSSQEIENEICYFVEAVENEGGLKGEQGFSWSNLGCITVVPEIFIANAIIPNAMEPNNQIKPVLTFIPRQYLYQVFDRWGNRIFETTDSETAWEGRLNGGNTVPEGVYVYYIKLTTSNGIEIEKKGMITVFYK